MYPHSGFRSGGTPAKTTLNWETTLRLLFNPRALFESVPRPGKRAPQSLKLESVSVYPVCPNGPLRTFCQTPPSYGSGRYGFGVFGAQDSVCCATGALWGRVTPFLEHFSKHLSSVWGGQSSVTRSGIPGLKNGPQIIRNKNHHLALFGSGNQTAFEARSGACVFRVPLIDPTQRAFLCTLYTATPQMGLLRTF